MRNYTIKNTNNAQNFIIPVPEVGVDFDAPGTGDPSALKITGNTFSGASTNEVKETSSNSTANMLFSIANDGGQKVYMRSFGSGFIGNIAGIPAASYNILSANGELILGANSGGSSTYLISNGVFIGYYTEWGGFIRLPQTPSTYAISSTLTYQDIFTGVIQNTGAAVNFTLPLADDLNSNIPVAMSIGASVEFTIDNSAGSGAATLVLNTGITNPALDSLVIAIGCVAHYKLYCTANNVYQINKL